MKVLFMFIYKIVFLILLYKDLVEVFYLDYFFILLHHLGKFDRFFRYLKNQLFRVIKVFLKDSSYKLELISLVIGQIIFRPKCQVWCQKFLYQKSKLVVKVWQARKVQSHSELRYMRCFATFIIRCFQREYCGSDMLKKT